MKLCKSCILRNHEGHYSLIPNDCKSPYDIIPLTEAEAYLWDYFDKTATREDMIYLVTSRYLASHIMAERLVEHFLKTLFVKGIIDDMQ